MRLFSYWQQHGNARRRITARISPLRAEALESRAMLAGDQWTLASGGNGHFYEFVLVGSTWSAAKSAAEARGGYLATITTATEQAFVQSKMPTNTWLWLGGYQDRTASGYSEPAGGWRWVSGEPWQYTNWNGRLDNAGGDEDYLNLLHDSEFGFWNDIPLSGMGYVGGSVVEYELPGTPTNVAGTAWNTQVSLSWTTAASAGSSAITDYVIQYSSNSGTSWTTFNDGTSTATFTTVTGLINGTGYIFRVAAVNSVGTGSYSANSSTVTPVTAHVAVTSITQDFSSAGSSYQATNVSGVAPGVLTDVDNNKFYRLTGATNGATCDLRFSDAVSMLDASVVEGSFDYRITNAQWVDGDGIRLGLTTTNLTTFGNWDGIGYPQSLLIKIDTFDNGGPTKAIEPNANHIEVSYNGDGTTTQGWLTSVSPTIDLSNDQWQKLAYRLSRTPGGAALDLSVLAGGTTYPLINALALPGFVFDTTYSLHLSANTGAAYSLHDVDNVSLVVLAAPAAPANVTGTARNTQVSLSWAAPTSAGSSEVTDYVIQYSSNTGSSWTTFNDGTSTATSTTVTGLINGTGYIFRVAAVNSAGTGTYSANSSTVTPLTTITFNVAAGQTVTDATLRTGSVQLVKQGPGVLVLTKANNFTGGTIVESGQLVIRNSAALGVGQLIVRPGATVTIDLPGAELFVGSLLIDEGGLIDTGTGRISIPSGGYSLGKVTDLLKKGYAANWAGVSGIGSSKARSEAERSLGYFIDDGGSITLGFAAPGDSNLDGVIDILDVGDILSAGKFNTGEPANWQQGDVNYDGVLDILDISEMLGTNLFNQGSYLTQASATSAAVETGTVATFDPALVFAALAMDSGQQTSTTKRKSF